MPQIETIFNKFTTQLDILRDNKIMEIDGDYICPICLKKFKEEQLEELSLEDAPQYSLGGSKIAITCKKCNNYCGHKIDSHLINYLKYLDQKDFVPGSDRRIKVYENDRILNARLEVSDNQEMKIILPDKINDPKKLEKHITNTTTGDIIDIENDK